MSQLEKVKSFFKELEFDILYDKEIIFKNRTQVGKLLDSFEIEYDKIDREWIGTPFHIIGISKFRG